MTKFRVDLVESVVELISLIFQKVFQDFSQVFVDGVVCVIFGSDGTSPVGGMDIGEDIYHWTSRPLGR